MTKQGALLGAQYQHRWVKVALNLTGNMSGTKPVKFVIADDEIQKIGSFGGHFLAQGHVNFNEK
jgi:hypothetical protein